MRGLQWGPCTSSDPPPLRGGQAGQAEVRADAFFGCGATFEWGGSCSLNLFFLAHPPSHAPPQAQSGSRHDLEEDAAASEQPGTKRSRSGVATPHQGERQQQELVVSETHQMPMPLELQDWYATTLRMAAGLYLEGIALLSERNLLDMRRITLTWYVGKGRGVKKRHTQHNQNKTKCAHHCTRTRTHNTQTGGRWRA